MRGEKGGWGVGGGIRGKEGGRYFIRGLEL